jgi:hypothetical protein
MNPDLALILGVINSVRTDASDDGRRLDATQTAFLARELDRLRAVEFTTDYPASKALGYLPLATDISPLDVTFSWKIWNETGHAKIVADDTDDLPEVDVSATEEAGRQVMLGVSYSLGVLELRRAAKLGIPLDGKKRQAAVDCLDRSIDELLRTGQLASTGQTTTGLGGFLNAALVDDNPGVLHNWLATATTAEEIVSDLAMIVQAIRTRTLDQYSATDILIPDALWYSATSKRMLYSQQNALKAFMQEHPEVQRIDPWTALNGIGGSSKHRLVAYAKTPQVLEAVVSQRFEQLPAQQRAMKISTPCLAVCGGTLIHRPAAVQYADFATTP